jgi:hypothetical protein
MLTPGLGKMHRAYLWSYRTTVLNDINAVVFDFDESQAGHNARRFLGIDEDRVGGWRGTLICDDYAGYKQAMIAGMSDADCLAHARRKFHELWANQSSTLAEQALKLLGVLYDVEREVKDLDGLETLRVLQLKSLPRRSAACLAGDQPAEAALPRQRRSGCVQQPHRKPDRPYRLEAQGLAARWQLECRPERCGHHEPATHCNAQRAHPFAQKPRLGPNEMHGFLSTLKK